MRRNRNNGIEITDEELDELLTADLKLSVSDDICVSEDLIERTLAAAKRGDEPGTPLSREEKESPEGRKSNLARFGRNAAAAAAVLVVLFAGGYAFTSFLSGEKKSADSAAGGAAPNLMATAAATAAPDNEAEMEYDQGMDTGALNAESGAVDAAGAADAADTADAVNTADAVDGCLPDTTAGGAAEFSGGEDKEFRKEETCLPSEGETEGNAQEHAPKAPITYSKGDKKTASMLTSLSGLEFCAETIQGADAVTVGREESEEVTLTGEQAAQLAQAFSETTDLTVLNGEEDAQTDSGQEDSVWIITAFYGEEAQLIMTVGGRIEIETKNGKDWKENGNFLVDDIQNLITLLESFMD